MKRTVRRQARQPRKLKQVLSAEEVAEIEDGGEVSSEDMLRAQMTARIGRTGHHLHCVHGDTEAKDAGVVRPRPGPDQPAGPDELPEAFHVYSMRQAIEEGFILDVLQNYTTYKLAFRLAHDGKEYDETEVERASRDEGHYALGAAAPVQHLAEGADRGRALP